MRPRSFFLGIGLSGILVLACWISGVGHSLVRPLASQITRWKDGFPAGSFEDREAAAKARIKDGAAAWIEYQSIARDPQAATHNAAAAGDFRLIQYHVYSMGGPRNESAFEGVDCSLPDGMKTLLTRAIWSTTISDVPAPGPILPGFDPVVARTYNLAMLHQDRFPYADLCLSDVDQTNREVKLAGDEVGQPLKAEQPDPRTWWQRWTNRPAIGLDGKNHLSIAVRNRTPLVPTNPSSVDETDEFGMTALGWAAARAPQKVVAALMAKGADPWFGDYCSTRRHGNSNYAPAGGNLLVSPIVIALVHKRTDIVTDMIRKAPRKECRGDPSGHQSALMDRLSVIRSVGYYAESSGFAELRRHMIADFIVHIPDFRNDSYAAYAYNDAAKYAWDNGLGDVFRSRPTNEILALSDFLGAMAANGSLDDIRYWVERLHLRSPEQLGKILTRIYFPLGGNDTERKDFAAKIGFVTGMTASFSHDKKIKLLWRIFIEGSLGPTERDIGAVRELLANLKANGYDLNGAHFSGRYGKDGGAARCSLLMFALTYHYRDECGSISPSANLAQALLEQGVDPNAGLTSSGLTALDIVRRRVDNGPYQTAFSKVMAIMLGKGARAGTAVQPPHD